MKFKAYFFGIFMILFIFWGCTLPGGDTPDDPTNNPTDADILPTDTLQAPQPSDTPPPAQDTPIPTDTATPENTPGVATGTIFYETEFDNASGWNDFPWWRSNVQSLAGSGFKTQIANYVAVIQAGVYRFEVPKKYTQITSIYAGASGYEDVSVIADTILTLDRPWTFISVICRYQHNVGWYEFYMQSDGKWGIVKISYIDGTVFEVKNLTSGFGTAINYGQHGALNQLEAVCLGDELIFRVNGVTLGSVRDSSYASGLIGVGVAAGEAGNSIAEFDSLRVQAP